MRTLYESLLDDEDDLLGDVSIVKNTKEDIKKFIEDNYHLRNHRGTLLNISRYIKINKDLTVDIKKKPGQYTELYTAHGIQGFPTNGLFKWGKVWNAELYCKNQTKFENLPLECNMLRISNALNINDLSGLPTKINVLNMYYFNNIKDLTTLPKDIKLERLIIYLATNLTSLAGCPDVKYSIDLHQCENLEKIPHEIHCEIFKIYGAVPKLNQSELKKIKSENIQIRQMR